MANPARSSEVFLIRKLSAVHRILVNGALEPLHGHDFQVKASFASEADPLELAAPLDELLAELNHRDLGPLVAGPDAHPSAERLAYYLLAALLRRGLPATRVRVQESPGCWATCTAPI
jgi:6-pyruvoyl-tetrahydropterin synthase